MKLRFRAILRTVCWPSLEQQCSDQEILIGGTYHVSFKFSDKRVDDRKAFLEIPIEIDVPQVKIYKTKLEAPIEGREFSLNPYEDKESLRRAYSIAAYIADVLQDQLHFCELIEESISPFKYIPETEADNQLLNCSTIRKQASWTFVWRTGDISIDLQALERYWNHRELLHIKAHGLRLKDPISAYRELYRVLDFAIKHLPKVHVKLTEKAKKSNIKKEDLVLAKHTGRKPEEFRDFRILRDRCSHAFQDFITYGKLEDLEAIQKALPKLKEIVDILERKLLNS